MRQPTGAIIALLAGLATTMVMFGVTRHLEHERHKSDFHNEAAKALTSLTVELSQTVGLLHDVRDSVRAPKQLTAERFRLVTEPLLRRHLYIQHFAYLQPIEGSRRTAFEARMRSRYPDYRIMAIAAGGIEPAGNGQTHLVAELLEPGYENEPLRRLDVLSIPSHKDALERSVRTGLPAATILHPPLHEFNGKPTNITILMPGTMRGVPGIPGVFVMTLNAAELFSQLTQAVSAAGKEGTGVTVYPGTSGMASPAIFHRGPQPPIPASSPNLQQWILYDQPGSVAQTLWLAGQPWHVRLYREPALFFHNHGGSPLVLACGILLSVLMATYLYKLGQRAEHVRQLVDLRTSELMQANALLQQDIANRKRLEKALLESEERFRQLTAMSSDWYWEQDEHLRFIQTFDKAGLPIESVIGKTRQELPGVDLHAPDWEYYRATTTARLPIVDFEYRLQSPNGRIRWVNINGEPIFGTDGSFQGYRGTAKDITARKQAELALQESEQRIRQLAAYQNCIREEERKRIAREIHDELGQNLLALQMELSLMQSETEGQPLLRQRAMFALERIDAAMKSVRAVINNLRPPVLDDGLHAAIDWQLAQFEKQHGICCKLEWDDAGHQIDDITATSLFRVVQESLNNVARHARASNVRITLAVSEGWLSLTVEDNGRGLNPEDRKKHDSFGLLGMEERVRMLGGKFSLTSLPGQGTRVQVEVPLREAAALEAKCA